MTRCRACRAPLLTARTPRGAVIDLDLEPAKNGTYRLEQITGSRPTAVPVSLDDRRRYPGELFVIHDATCPEGEEQQRLRRAQVDRVRAERQRFWGD